MRHPAVTERAVLRASAGLIRRTKAGRTVTVHLEHERLRAAEEWLHRTRTFWTTQVGNLARSFHPTTKEQ